MSAKKDIPAGTTDTWDDMRARTWDLYVDGKPCDSLDVLLGVLGAAGKPAAYQREAVSRWLDSAASVPAPQSLLKDARAFTGRPGD